MSFDRSQAPLLRTPVALALIALNVAVYLTLTAAPGLEQVLGLPAGWEAVADRPWTPVSVIFTAGNLLHLAGAVGFVFVFGRGLEELAGGIHLLTVYLLTGLAGSMALTALAGPTGLAELSLGASASFLGLFGAIAVLPHPERPERFPVRPILAAIFLVNIAGPLMGLGGWVGSAAHGAGIAVGALYGRALRSRRGRMRAPRARRPRGHAPGAAICDPVKRPDRRRGAVTRDHATTRPALLACTPGAESKTVDNEPTNPVGSARREPGRGRT